MWLYALPIFLSALLLFMVQPVIAKHILPWFGGTPAVWTTCMVFFQSALLAGYAYAHAITRLLSARGQAVLHMALLMGCVLLLPIIPAEAWKPLGGQSEIPLILGLLAVTIGGPYLILAANGPLLQAWFSRMFPGRSPYRLFALSNAGSLLALLSYPVMLEPMLSLRTQEYLWSGMFIAFAATCGLCAWRIYKAKPSAEAQAADPESEISGRESEVSNLSSPIADAGANAADGASAPGPAGACRSASSIRGPARAMLTLLLPACACVILLATTNQMSQDLPVVPFLWVLPLSLYLLTFILCFDREMWYPRPLWMALMALGLWGIHEALRQGVEMGAGTQVFLYCGGMFACCMVCHGELARLRPEPAKLTGYYLLISAGGALGGVFVTLVAPAVFSGYWEFQGSLIAAGALLAVVIVRDKRFIRIFNWTGPRWLRAGLASACLALLAILTVGFIQLARDDADGVIESSRSFYGVLQVDRWGGNEQYSGYVNLRHGRILHGSQYNAPDYNMAPVSYYGPSSGIGVAHAALRLRGVTSRPATAPAAAEAEYGLDEIAEEAWPGFPPPEDWRKGNNLRIGAVGLGAGVLATYGREGDYIRFYEINPDMVRISDAHFTYRRQSKAKIDLVLGDARLTMERELREGRGGQFDVIVLDAFSGDSIPLHLLTVEAMELYLRHLRPDGVLAFHVSNRYVRLEGLIRGLARRVGRLSLLIDSNEQDEPYLDSTTWVLVTASQELIDDMWWRRGAAEWPEDGAEPIVFTDDYSNLARLLDLRGEWEEVKAQARLLWRSLWTRQQEQ